MNNDKKYLTRKEFYAFLEEDRKKWEESNKRWWENQKKWEEKWEENQKKWEEKWEENQKKWEKNQRQINRMLAHLSKHGDFIGFGIEGIAAIMLPLYLEDKYRLRVKELKKEVISVNGRECEINLLGRAGSGRKKTAILVECKSTIGRSNIRAFLRKIRLVEPFLESQGMNVIKIVFGPFIHHSAARIAREEGIEMVSSVPQKV